MKILILNGPNLNLLGKREPTIYGQQSFLSYFESLQSKFPEFKLSYFQSNHEGELIDYLHNWEDKVDGIVFNPGAYTHTSVAIADAVSGISTPVVEVHISNVHAREAFRVHSYMSPVCAGTLSGFGISGYELAVRALINQSNS